MSAKESVHQISSAMVLAAGLGKRMRPLTNERPKPLIPVLGKPMLDTILDRLQAADLARIVVNAHYLRDHIVRHVEERGEDNILLSLEDELLETGGGIVKALPLLGDAPFLAVNGDVCWSEGASPAFERLMAAWDPARMDALLLLQPTARAVGYEGAGDFFGPEPGAGAGALRRRGRAAEAPYVYAGIQILHPRLFENAPEGAFSLNVTFDRALAAERLYGLVHDGDWYHVGTPEGLAEVEGILRAKHGEPPAVASARKSAG